MFLLGILIGKLFFWFVIVCSGWVRIIILIMSSSLIVVVKFRVIYFVKHQMVSVVMIMSYIILGILLEIRALFLKIIVLVWCRWIWLILRFLNGNTTHWCGLWGNFILKNCSKHVLSFFPESRNLLIYFAGNIVLAGFYWLSREF